MKTFLKTIVVLFILFHVQYVKAAENNYPIPEDTKLFLPLKSGITVGWVLPVEDNAQEKKTYKPPGHFRFAIDPEGIPWFGFEHKLLVNFGGKVLFAVDQPYEDFNWLDNGNFVICTKTAWGFLEKASEKNIETEESIHTFRFRPVLKLPYENFRIFPGRENSLYLVGYNSSKREGEVYLLIQEKQKWSIKKLFAIKKRITAVTGRGEETYVAIGRSIIKLSPDENNIKCIFLHPKEKITGLEFSKESGLFYTTESAVGYVYDAVGFEFLESPDTQIRLLDESVFVLLGETYRVLKIDGINKFRNLELGPAEGQTPDLETTGGYQLRPERSGKMRYGGN